jgi:hypothetical protein
VLLAILLAPRAAAADILIPEATPESLDDFSVAYMVYDLVATELNSGMFRVDDADRIRAWAGKDADACFDVPECPGNLWGRTDARLAVVMGVGHTDAGLSITVRFYDPDHTDPIREMQDVVPAGAELAFAKDVVMAVNETIVTIPPRGRTLTGTGGTSTGTGGTSRTPAPADDEEVLPPVPDEKGGRVQRPPRDEDEELDGPRPEEHDDTPVTKDRKPLGDDDEVVDDAEKHLDEKDLPSTRELAKDRAQDEAERRQMGIPQGAYERYKDSGLSQKEWMRSARVRHLGAFVEAAGGYGIGDTDRAYGVWVNLVDSGDGTFTSSAASTWEGSGKGPDGGAGLAVFGAVGLTATWWFEFSVAGGIQQGKKYLEAGWECTACSTPTESVPFDPVTGTQLWIQPKVRFLPVVTGLVKPYVVVSGDIALYDGFVPDTELVDFPDAGSGANWGVGVGLGVAVDALPNLSFFAEVPFSVTLSPLWHSYDDPAVATQPAGIAGQGSVLRLLGGVSVRF